MSESDAREAESMRMALSSKEMLQARSFAVTTPPKVLSFRWEELRSFVPYIGDFSRSNVDRYLCAEHGMLDVDSGKLDLYQIADLIQADAEKHKARMGNSNPIKRPAETLPGGDEADGKQPKPKGTGHRRTSEELFKAALRTHHKYEAGGSVLNVEPASTRQIESLTNSSISDSTAGRLLTKHFGSVEKYRDACFSGAIGPKLVVLLGDGLHAFGSFDATERDVEDQNDNDSDE